MHVTIIQNPKKEEEDASNQPLYFPTTVTIEHFQVNPSIRDIPKTWKDCIDNHFPIREAFKSRNDETYGFPHHQT